MNISKFIVAPLLVSFVLSAAACGGDEFEEPERPLKPDASVEADAGQNQKSMNIKFVMGDVSVSASLDDNAAAHDLLSRLPLEVTLEDFNNTTEKIFYPEPGLNLDGVPRGCAPMPGDITIYVPWNNVAVFCKEWPFSKDLVKIGHIDGDGIRILSTGGNIRVRLENISE